MKPTKEQLKDPQWWKDNVDGKYDFAYTTGPEWDGGKGTIGKIEFADNRGLIKNMPSLVINDTAWVLLCERPKEFIPEIGDWCECLDTTWAHPQWRKCKPRFIGSKKIIYDTEYEEESYTFAHNLKFRPLKTEREAFIDWACNVMNNSVDDSQEGWATALYDNGARIVEGEPKKIRISVRGK